MRVLLMGEVVRVRFESEDTISLLVAKGATPKHAADRGCSGYYDFATDDLAMVEHRVPPLRPGVPTMWELRTIEDEARARASERLQSMSQACPVVPATVREPVTMTTRTRRGR